MLDKFTLDKIDRLGFGKDLKRFEDYVIQIEEASKNGNMLVDKNEYKQYAKLCNRPVESLDGNYEKSRINTYSIINNLNELKPLANIIGNKVWEMICSPKLVGFEHLRIYEYGKLIIAKTPGIKENYIDITNSIVKILGSSECEALQEIPKAIVKGEVVVRGNLGCRGLDYIDSLLKGKTEEGIDTLDIVDFDIASTSLSFNSLMDKHQFLRDTCGFKVTDAELISLDGEDFNNGIEHIIDRVSETAKDSSYDTMGVLMSQNYIDNLDNMHNYLLRLGETWCCGSGCTIIQGLEWEERNGKIVPKARVHIETKEGIKFEYVYLHSLGIVSKYKYYKGSELYYKYHCNQIEVTSADGTVL